MMNSSFIKQLGITIEIVFAYDSSIMYSLSL